MNRCLNTSSSSSTQEPLPLAAYASPGIIDEEGALLNPKIEQDIIPPTSTSSKRVPIRNKTSKVWLYFDLKDEKATCSLCKTQFAHKPNSGTGTLARHLNRIHRNWEDNDVSDDYGRQPNIDNSPSGFIANVTTYTQEDVRCQLAKMVVGAELPFTFVQSHYFTDYMKTAQPGFEQVSRNTVYKDGYKLYEHEIIALKHLFDTITSKISLTIDLWLGRGSLRYLCITAHWINDSFMFEKRIIEFSVLEYPHDGLSIYRAILSSLNYWEINDKIMSISFDDASIDGRDIELLVELFRPMFDSKFQHACCVCHVLHLCVNDVMESVRPCIDDIRNNLTYICSSPDKMQKYRKMVENAKMNFKIPYLDLKTRWSSTYKMLMEALPYASIISQVIREDCHGRFYRIRESDWEIIEVIAPLLQTLSTVSNIMSDCFNPTSNIMLPNMLKIVKLFDEHRNDKNVKEIMKTLEAKWLKYYEIIPSCAIFSCIFDPRCKLDGCVLLVEEYYRCLGSKTDVDHRKEISDCLDELVEKYPSRETTIVTTSSPSKSSSSTFRVLETLKRQKSSCNNTRSTCELTHYLYLPVENDSDDFDVLQWWKSKEENYPVLSVIARDLLTSQMSSVASESAFSAGARTVTDSRTRLTPKSVKFCMLLKNWMDEEYRLKNLERVGRYKIPEMKEDYFDDDEAAFETTTIATGQGQDQDIERHYFPNPEYYYSNAETPNFTYDWQKLPD